MRSVLLSTLFLMAAMSLQAADPTETRYSATQCEGSFMPYPVPEHPIEFADSLTPVFINHVGRHGARFPSSPKYAVGLREILLRADSLGSITADGRRLLDLTEYVIDYAHNRWGALDSVGMAEQRGIASRMFMNFPRLFDNKSINAISTYAPRCVMSMYEFTHQLDRLNNHLQISTSSGRQNSSLLRPFDVNADYLEWRKKADWEKVYNEYVMETVPSDPLRRILGQNFELPDDWQKVAMDEYSFLAGMSAMGFNVDITPYFTTEEYNALWSCANLKQYLVRTATTVSTIPGEITSPLILDLIHTGDEAVRGTSPVTVCLRFGHAETLMPLLSQLHLQGCYYMTNYFDTVAQHWCNFHVVPMASNLQMVILRSDTGRHYMATFLNEQPVPLIPGDARTIIPYAEARDYMQHCVPAWDI